MKNLRHYIDLVENANKPDMKVPESDPKLDEISRRGFLKGVVGAAGLAAVGKAGAQGNDWEYGRNALGNPSQTKQSDWQHYSQKLRACILPAVSFPVPPRKGTENPTAQFRISLDDGTGLVDGVTLIKSSGNNNFDRAVKTGILRCNPLPKPPKSSDGKYPQSIDINYKMHNDE